VFDLSQANQQVDWITDENGKVFVDTIYRYENLENDFADMRNRIGIQATLPKKNTTKHKNYREYYTEETKKLVAELYKDDIEMFGYVF
jgi:chondroitin 4-sulfotransferase 11